MELTIRSDQPIKVTGEGFDERIALDGETVVLSGTSFNVVAAPPESFQPRPAPTGGVDVFDQTNRPNGPMTAVIAPKLPKAGGETEQVVAEGGRVVERQIAPRGEAEQGGGPASTDGLTPGPKPDNAEPAALGQAGAATGDVDARGAPKQEGPQNPAPATRQRVTATAPKTTGAKKSSRR